VPVQEPSERRELALRGGDNVRDLGGIALPGGAVTRRGRLFRGAFIPSLAAADLTLLRGQVGLRTVIDLRADAEVDAHPGPWEDHGFTSIRCAFDVPPASAIPYGNFEYAALYLGFLERSPEAVATAVEVALRPESHPLLFHCAAGKDRTGVLSALLLDLLEVERDLIALDYELTAASMPGVLARLSALDVYSPMLAGATEADLRPVGGTILKFFEGVDERYGGSRRWLVERGIEPAQIDDFRALMGAYANL
jgi:hypothetical protein